MLAESADAVTTDIPQRLDRLPWSRWHWMVVTALGVTWFLDGLEVTIVAALGPVLTHAATLHLSASEVGLTASAYLAGSVLGALIFSYLTDRQGRKKWFLITLGLYLVATVLTAFSWNLASFMCFRFLTGAGIGGEYAAINSAVDELIPARYRGHAGLAINGSWWLGSAIGALLTLVLLNPVIFPEDIGWRLCFIFGTVLGVGIALVRRAIPESPRWLMTRRRTEEAEAVVSQIERQIAETQGAWDLPAVQEPMTLRACHAATVATVARELFRSYPRRTWLCLSLMITQSFLYNAVSFTFPLLLTKYYGLSAGRIGLYLLPFACGNFLGPLLLGRFFDTIGRKPMISFSYAMAGLLLGMTGYLFRQGSLTLAAHMAVWSAIFFFASAGASAAYLTVSEVFPLEIRAMAIAFFFVTAQGAAVVAPWLYGSFIESSSTSVFYGYLLIAVMMLTGALAELLWGVKAERQPLERIAMPLSVRSRPDDLSRLD
ncbi:MAG: MFS transporter [Nitrospira sp. CR1.3]|nr:MFS transporter [Nitrospira sp. CR1.3]